jgi:polyisoprenoid-binding protein YceI
MESEKFPKSTFKGNITNIKKVNFAKDGNYPVTVKGTLELHGVKNEVETTGMIKVAGESVIATADFSILLADYKIPVPSVVGEKLSKSAKIKVNCTYSVLNK